MPHPRSRRSYAVLLLGRIAPPAKERPRFRGTRSRSRSVARLIVGLLPHVSPSDRQATRPPIIRLLVFGLGDAPARACREAAAESQHAPQFSYRWNTGWILDRTTRAGAAQNNLTCQRIILRYNGGRMHRSTQQDGRPRQNNNIQHFL